MRGLIFGATLAAAVAGAPAQAAAVWSAACYGQNSVQYLQTIGGDGYLHWDNGSGSYTTIKLKQVYFDGKVVCGATTTKPGSKDIGGICADNENQKIRLQYGVQIANGIKPQQVAAYCDAQVTVTQ